MFSVHSQLILGLVRSGLSLSQAVQGVDLDR
jgi:hypothetical protein